MLVSRAPRGARLPPGQSQTVASNRTPPEATWVIVKAAYRPPVELPSAVVASRVVR
jgi:hypothetical protein